jgi:hypothetical protein
MKRVVLVATCAVLLCGCGSPSGKLGTWRGPGIALERRIGAVSIGERKRHVDAALGRGEERRLDSSDETVVFYPRSQLYVDYYRTRPGQTDIHDLRSGNSYVSAIITRSSLYKMAEGIGVGSTLAEIPKGVNFTCQANFTDPNGPPSSCQQDAVESNMITVFAIDAKTRRVDEVAIYDGG